MTVERFKKEFSVLRTHTFMFRNDFMVCAEDEKKKNRNRRAALGVLTKTERQVCVCGGPSGDPPPPPSAVCLKLQAFILESSERKRRTHHRPESVNMSQQRQEVKHRMLQEELTFKIKQEVDSEAEQSDRSSTLKNGIEKQTSGKAHTCQRRPVSSVSLLQTEGRFHTQ